jgi:hypothetical protein
MEGIKLLTIGELQKLMAAIPPHKIKHTYVKIIADEEHVTLKDLDDVFITRIKRSDVVYAVPVEQE